MSNQYIPKVGDKINVYHPSGVYCDPVKGNITSQDYEIIGENKKDKDRQFVMKSGKDKITEVELNWFNTELTGRIIKTLN